MGIKRPLSDDDILDREDAARILKTTPAAIDRRMQDRSLAHIKIGRDTRILVGDLRAFIEAVRVAAVSAAESASPKEADDE